MDPINYMAMMPQLNLGQQFAELGQVIAERRQRIAAEEAQKAYASDLQSAIDTPTQATWSAMIAKYPKQREAFEAARKGFGEDRVKKEFNNGFEISLALENGRPDVAKQRIQTILEAKKNSNQPAGIYQQVFDALESGNVKGAQAGVNLALSILDPDAFKKTVDGRVTAEKAPSEIRLSEATAAEKEIFASNAPAKAALENANTRAQIRNIESQISERSGRMALDRDKLQTDVEMKLYELGQKASTLDEGARKLINDSSIASVSSEQSAARALDLANRIESAQGGMGAATKASEWLARATGRTDEWTLLRQEYARIRNLAAIKVMPPGHASDKDVQFALKGMPDESANSQTVASFLRGMAKLQQLEAATEAAKAEWVNSVGSLGKAKKDIDVAGVQVPAGTSFVEFAREYAGKGAQGLMAQQANTTISGRSYMRFANPQGGK